VQRRKDLHEQRPSNEPSATTFHCPSANAIRAAKPVLITPSVETRVGVGLGFFELDERPQLGLGIAIPLSQRGYCVTPFCNDEYMSSLADLNPGVAALSSVELEQYCRDLDRLRRKVDAKLAALVHHVGETGRYVDDKHRSPKAWGKATCNWSSAEAARFVKAGTMLATFDTAVDLATRGDLGVAQMTALAQLVSNPRVKEHLADGEELLVGQAAELDYDDYANLLANWERVADVDGAHHDSERTHRHRKASGTVVGDQFFLDAVCGLAQGLQMKEILDAFAKSEWMADWERGVATHGNAMAAHLMERTDPQRRMDALLAIFLKAAGADADSTGSGFTINLTVGLPAFEHHLAKAMGTHPAPLDPNDPFSRCETNDGTPVDPFDMLAAATIGHVRRVVLDSSGVVVNMGRKQRLFSGALRDAVRMQSKWCTWVGCDRPGKHCEADHLLPWANAGPTDSRNGGPLCGYHNRWKATGYTTWRDPQGHWHHYRPDGTEIGWRSERNHASNVVFTMPAAS